MKINTKQQILVTMCIPTISILFYDLNAKLTNIKKVITNDQGN